MTHTINEIKPYKMTVVPKTIFIMVGPPNCGKSHFCNHLQSQLTCLFKSKILSSDQYRRELLGDPDRHKHDQEMMNVSEGAFEKLFHDLVLATKFPQNFDFIFVDTTGISKDFRDKVITVAKQAHYRIEMILFNYKDTKDYFKLGANKYLTSKFLTRMRQETMRELNRKAYEQVHQITEISLPEVTGLGAMTKYSPMAFNLRNFDGILNVNNAGVGVINAPPISTFAVGDVHGCFDEMVELLAKKDFVVNPETLVVEDVSSEKQNHARHLVFVGDLIDKGPDSKKLIEFAHANRENLFVFFVQCNHGNFVSKYMQGLLSEVEPKVLEYFDTISLLQADAELYEKFKSYWSSTIPYYRNRKVIITHAPCENVYLEKASETALRQMRNFRYPKVTEVEGDFDKELQESLSFLEKDAVRNHPYHIFGHISFENIFSYRNKIGLDTGCYAGGRLSMVEIPHYQSKPFYHSVPSRMPKLEGKIHKAPQFAQEFSVEYLEPKDFRRVRFMADNKVNFVSGTVAPADKDLDKGELESLSKGLQYYTDLGYTQFSIQPKYMGSRCNMYLYYKEDGELDLDKCFATSRQGYKIRQLDLKELFIKTNENMLFDTAGLSLVILDGELLPWSAMGTGLIDKTFYPLRDAVNNELEWLEASGFEDSLLELKVQMSNTSFAEEVTNWKKSALVEKYGNSKYSNYKALLDFTFAGVSVYKALNKTYSDQLDIFTESGELEYRPWAILKTESHEGVVSTQYGADVFRLVNPTGGRDLVFNTLQDPDYLLQLQSFWHDITQTQGMEGVVIKPLSGVNHASHAPFIKVRNPRYLTLVYGYDYILDSKYRKLIKQKSVNRKMRISAKEYSIGQRMLEIPNQHISLDNKEWVRLAAAMVTEEKNEQGLDPRL